MLLRSKLLHCLRWWHESRWRVFLTWKLNFFLFLLFTLFVHVTVNAFYHQRGIIFAVEALSNSFVALKEGKKKDTTMWTSSRIYNLHIFLETWVLPWHRRLYQCDSPPSSWTASVHTERGRPPPCPRPPLPPGPSTTRHSSFYCRGVFWSCTPVQGQPPLWWTYPPAGVKKINDDNTYCDWRFSLDHLKSPICRSMLSVISKKKKFTNPQKNYSFSLLFTTFHKTLDLNL